MNDDGRQWPRIYLTYQDGSYEQPVLWCQDRIDDSDIEYVNVAAFNAQADRIVELEANVELFRRCHEAAREIWHKGHPERAELWDPSGEKAIAVMIAEHSFWEKHSLAELAERNEELRKHIAELEAHNDTA